MKLTQQSFLSIRRPENRMMNNRRLKSELSSIWGARTDVYIDNILYFFLFFYTHNNWIGQWMNIFFLWFIAFLQKCEIFSLLFLSFGSPIELTAMDLISGSSVLSTTMWFSNNTREKSWKESTMIAYELNYMFLEAKNQLPIEIAFYFRVIVYVCVVCLTCHRWKYIFCFI